MRLGFSYHKGWLIGGLLILLTPLSDSFGEIQSVWITPDEPTCRTEVVLHIHGALPDGCWSAGPGKAEVVTRENLFDVTIPAIDRYKRGYICPAVLIPYEFSFPLGFLPAGTKWIEMRESFQSKRTAEPPILRMILSVLPDSQNPCSTPTP
jgi:hypothetical protein